MRSIVAIQILLLATFATGAVPGKSVFQVVGRILQGDGVPFRDTIPVVFLHGTLAPFSAQAPVGPDGRFRFKKIPAGTYTLSAAVPRLGEKRKTIEVGASFADSNANVIADISFDGTVSWEKKGTVSAAELSVSENAKQEYLKALDCLSRQDVQGAIARLGKAVELSPQFAIALNQLGTIAYQTGKFQEAEEYFRASMKQDPGLYAPLVNLGGALLALRRDEAALPVNLDAVRIMPGDALAHSQLGKNYYYLSRFDEAETHLKRAEALDPSHFSYPQIVLIDIYLKTNRLPAAIEEMESFLRLHPDSNLVPKIRKLLEAAHEMLSRKN
jgi:tetratricopeptide (TPR) repeat protein